MMAQTNNKAPDALTIMHFQLHRLSARTVATGTHQFKPEPATIIFGLQIGVQWGKL
jgi:hypothetical protein